MADRFENIELTGKARIKKEFNEFSSVGFSILLTLLLYLLILYCGFNFERLCNSPLLNGLGIGLFYLLLCISIVISAIIGFVTGEFDMFKELCHSMISLPHPQFRAALGLTIVMAFLISLAVIKFKRWQNPSKSNITLNIIFASLLFIGGWWAIKHNMLMFSYGQVLLLALNFLPFSYIGFWNWQFWRKRGGAKWQG